MAGDDPRAIDAQPVCFLDQAELDSVPIEPGEMIEAVIFQGPQAAPAIGRHIIGKDRVREHRHMAEHVMKHVRFLQIIKLFASADEITGNKATIGEVIEKNIIGNQPRNRDHFPAGRIHQSIGKLGKVGNARLGEIEYINSVQKGLACTARQLLNLPFEQDIPGFMIFDRIGVPILRDRPILGSALWRAFKNMCFGCHGNRIASKA